jgi:Protein of unknown function (DUF2817)
MRVIGTPGKAWAQADIADWRSQVTRQRSYADEVLLPLERLPAELEQIQYGELSCAGESLPLVALRSRDWQPDLPCALISGGVHGYETSGVQGALRFALSHARSYADKVNLLIAPCVSPWAYERVQRWNFDALDPNRNFREGSRVQESAALLRLVAPLRGEIMLHMDLHETTDSDEFEFRPMLAARDGKVFEPGSIPDGFYAVDDASNPQPAFQRAIIAAVSQVTHIAPADAQGQIIGSKLVAPGVIEYSMQALGLCASISAAPYTCTTEVYPDSPLATPELCIAAQVAAVCAGIDFLISR